MSLGSRYVSSLHTGYLKVFDLEGLPYVDAVADLFHYGHTNFFQKAREVVFQLVIARTQAQDQPALISSTVSAIFASRAGFRQPIASTRVPSSTRRVMAARAERNGHDSQTPLGCSSPSSL